MRISNKLLEISLLFYWWRDRDQFKLSEFPVMAPSVADLAYLLFDHIKQFQLLSLPIFPYFKPVKSFLKLNSSVEKLVYRYENRMTPGGQGI